MRQLRILGLGLLVPAVLLLVVVPGGAAPGDTIRVSVDSAGNEGNGASFQGTISGDGRYIAFVSEATNLVPGDTNGVQDTFVHDTITGTDPADNCPEILYHDAWPPDMASDVYGEHNGVIDTTDLAQVLPPYWGTTPGDALYSTRRDLFPDGVIDITDLARVLPPYWGYVCE